MEGLLIAKDINPVIECKWIARLLLFLLSVPGRSDEADEMGQQVWESFVDGEGCPGTRAAMEDALTQEGWSP